jgi:hypothetical protein
VAMAVKIWLSFLLVDDTNPVQEVGNVCVLLITYTQKNPISVPNFDQLTIQIKEI